MIKSYLTDRFQRNLINNNFSKGVSGWHKLRQGVPQGSILGPLAFLVYINDLPYLINKSSKPVLYAVDTSILCINPNSSELEKVINAILIKINEWFSVNSLTLNLNKINFIYFTSKQKPKHKLWRY
jgi:hypothetical protein